MTGIYEYIIDEYGDVLEENETDEETNTNDNGDPGNQNTFNINDLLYPGDIVIPAACPEPLPLELREILKYKLDPAVIINMRGPGIDNLNISQIIESVSITENEDGHDTCSIQFKQIPREKINSPIFNARNEVDIYMGYISEGLEFMNTFVLDNPDYDFSDNISITMNGKDIGIKINEGQKQKVYNNVSDVEVLYEIARKNKFLLMTDLNKINPSMLTKYESVAQAGVTDLELARYRAIFHGLRVDVMNKNVDGIRTPVIYFGPPRDCDSGVILNYRDRDPDRCNLLSFKPTETTFKRGCVVKMGVQDPRKPGPQFSRPIPNIEFVREERDENLNRDIPIIRTDFEFDDSNEVDITPQFSQCVHLNNDHPLMGSFTTDRPYNVIRSEPYNPNIYIQERIAQNQSRAITGDNILDDINFSDENGETEPGNDIVDTTTIQDPEFYNNIQDEHCELIIDGIGHREDSEELCRISQHIQEAIQFIVEASMVPAVGDPRLRKSKFVTVNGVGKFSGRYYIKQVTHTVDSSGYKISNLIGKTRATHYNSVSGPGPDDSDIIIGNPTGGGGSGPPIKVIIEEDY